jgi:hypothetical protein
MVPLRPNLCHNLAMTTTDAIGTVHTARCWDNAITVYTENHETGDIDIREANLCVENWLCDGTTPCICARGW